MIEEEWTTDALSRIAQRRRNLGKQFAQDDPQLWEELDRVAKLENFVLYCQEHPEPSRRALLRLANCKLATIEAYWRLRASPDASWPEEILADLEENGVLLREENEMHWMV
jgi:hypothetical protein